MPEGDTVWRTAARLHEALGGAPLERVDLRWPTLATADLRGAITLEVRARGKHLLHRLSCGLTLHSHLRMEGQWRVEATDRLTTRRLADPDLRAVVGTERWTALGLRLGMLDLVRTVDEVTLVGHLGPDLLGPDVDPARAVANLAAGPEVPIGAALLDQRNLAGIGTFYAAEALFLERLPPWTPVGTLPAVALGRLVERAQRLLDAGRGHAVQSTTGDRRAGHTAYVHRRAGQPCRRCGAAVRVAPIGPPTQERTMFYCPGCQGGLGPTDDGRPLEPFRSPVPSRPPRSPGAGVRRAR